MTAFDFCRGHCLGWIPVLACLAIAASGLLQPALGADSVAVPSSAMVTVHLDQAKVLKLPERTATLVVGNPLIADVALQPGGILVVTAKSYGVTNVLALDRTGVMLIDQPIQVMGPRDNVVVVYRGIERESYSCMPNCERRIMLGDTANYFSANLGQSGSLSSQAQGHGQQQQK